MPPHNVEQRPKGLHPTHSPAACHWAQGVVSSLGGLQGCKHYHYSEHARTHTHARAHARVSTRIPTHCRHAHLHAPRVEPLGPGCHILNVLETTKYSPNDYTSSNPSDMQRCAFPQSLADTPGVTKHFNLCVSNAAIQNFFDRTLISINSQM